MTFDPTLPHKNIDGVKINLTQSEIDALAAEQAIYEAGAAKRDALKQIVALENTQTPRRIREAVNGIDNGWLKNLNDEIETLRGQLK